MPLAERLWAAVDGVRDVRRLPDGRVRALVDVRVPPEPRDRTFADVFVQAGDRWLIDEEAVVAEP